MMPRSLAHMALAVLALALIAILFLAPWLAVDPGAYIPPWLEGLLGVSNVAGGGVIGDLVGGLLDFLGAGGGDGGVAFPIDTKSIEALQTLTKLFQESANLTAWTLFRESFVSLWIKIGLIAVALTAIISLLAALLLLLNSDELAQIADWIGAGVGVIATALLVITMPQLLRLGAPNDIGIALITAVFNVHLGYGFWAGMILTLASTGVNAYLAFSPPVSHHYHSRRHSRRR